MRPAAISGLCVFLLLICSPRPTAGQSNPSNRVPNPQNPPASAKPSELPRAAKTFFVPAQTDSTNQLTNPQRSWMNLLSQQNTSDADQRRADLKKGILSQVESSRCAHIVIFRAPDTDSEMIVEAPPGLGGNITTFKGLRPCCGDLRGLHGLPGVAPEAPRIQPPK